MKNKVFAILTVLILAVATNGFAAETLSFAGLTWTQVDDVWQVTDSGLINAGTASTNTHIFAPLDQTGNILTYTWTIYFGDTASATSGPMAGLHLFVTDPWNAGRGDSLLIFQDQNRLVLYEGVNGTLPGAYRLEVTEAKVTVGETHSYKAVVNTVSGAVEIYRDEQFLYTWQPKNPIPDGSYISFRTNRTIAMLMDFSFSSK